MEIPSYDEDNARAVTLDDNSVEISINNNVFFVFKLVEFVSKTNECAYYRCLNKTGLPFLLQVASRDSQFLQEIAYLKTYKSDVAFAGKIVLGTTRLKGLEDVPYFDENLTFFLLRGNWTSTLAEALARRSLNEMGLNRICAPDALRRLLAQIALYQQDGLSVPLLVPSHILVQEDAKTNQIVSMMPASYKWAFQTAAMATIPDEFQFQLYNRIVHEEPHLRQSLQIIMSQGPVTKTVLLVSPLFRYALDSALNFEEPDVYLLQETMPSFGEIEVKMRRLELDVSPGKGTFVTREEIQRELAEKRKRFEETREKRRHERLDAKAKKAAFEAEESKRLAKERRRAEKIRKREEEEAQRQEALREAARLKREAEEFERKAQKAAAAAERARKYKEREEYMRQYARNREESAKAREAKERWQRWEEMQNKQREREKFTKANYASELSTPRPPDWTSNQSNRAPWTFRQWIKEVAPL